MSKIFNDIRNGATNNDIKTVSPVGEVFRNSVYCHILRTSLGQIHSCQQHNCFTLNADNESVHICRILLKVASPYFANIRNSDIKGKLEELVKLRKIDISALKQVACYTRNGIIIISEENVESLLSISDRFQTEWIKDKCCQFLRQRLKYTNCFSIRRLANLYSCKELYDFSSNYILRRFDKLTNVGEFLLLSLEEFEELIKDDELCVKSEKNVLQAVMKWIKHSPGARKNHFERLMNSVRLHLIGKQYLIDHVVGEPLITHDSLCMKLILETLKYNLVKSSKAKKRSMIRNGTLYLRFVRGLRGKKH